MRKFFTFFSALFSICVFISQDSIFRVEPPNWWTGMVHNEVQLLCYGNNLANYPSVAGQQVGYLVSSLKAYRSKERNAGEQSLVMQSIAENLTDNEIDALANYMHGLYK